MHQLILVPPFEPETDWNDGPTMDLVLDVPELVDCPRCGWFKKETEPGSGFFSCDTCDLPKDQRK